jgi:NAD(P)-dependent dehydrogenase (short-subunit alcohol dehydrogenase family)
MDLQLKDKVALVTGGSRGIGRAIAAALAREGVDLAIVGRDTAAAGEAAAAIAAETGRTVRPYRADSGRDEEVRAAVAAIAGDFGRVDILVNCAAMPAGQGPVPLLAELTDEAVLTEVNVKVVGYLRFARAVVPHMKRHGFGRIVNIAGLAARQTGSIAGSIRNVGVAALTKNLADELGPDGINVTCVHPGLTRTEKTPAALRYHAQATGISSEEVEARFAAATSIRHMVTAEEVADVVAFLASPRSVAITGDAIAAGGGRPGAIYY